ncbi:MAG TPA: 3-deoxy-D-manno-octulosonic acid transferase [Deltaproteobacteria bacterium]|nr:3-deoxy-D-manno-octulosonic acid transferase [Deltaproteobacteria bacterium]
MAGFLILLYRMLVSVLMWPAALALRRHPNFAGTIAARLGLRLPEVPDGRPLIWVHAASVGEVRAASGLLAELKRQMPDLVICLSSMTATGRQVASKDASADLVIPFPFDSPRVMRRYLLRLSPRALVIVETELWPGMILEARRLGIPVGIVNARMTERSFRRYARVLPLVKNVLEDIEVLAMAHADAERFSQLGAGRVQTVGNLKIDMLVSTDRSARERLRGSLGAGDRPVFIAGSVREGEEEMVVDAVRSVASRIPGLFTVIAPRHPRQIGRLSELVKEANLRWCLRSGMEADVDLVIVDTMGELFDLYGASDAAFVGGSLVDLGGQNVLEPIAWEVPTIHGPHMSNFVWALELVDGHTITVHDSSSLAGAAADILAYPEKYRVMAAKARALVEEQRGVTQRYLSKLEDILRI